MIHISPITPAPRSWGRCKSIVRGIGAAVAVALLVTPVQAQSLVTAAPNNGSGGVFLDLTAGANPLDITSFETPFSGAVGLAVTVEVWTRPGSYVGFTGSNAGWVLSETVGAVAAGTTTFAPVVLVTPLSIGAGSTLGVYLHSTTTGGGIRYTGTTAAPPQTLWSNADLTLFSDVSRTGTVPFAGTQFTPRTFSGVVNYTIIPTPGAIALLAVAGLVGRRRRR